MQVAALWHKGEKREYLITVSLSGAINILDQEKPDSPFSIQGIQAAPTDLKVDQKDGSFYVTNIEGYAVKYDWKDGNGSFFSGKGHAGKTVHHSVVSGDHLVTVGFDDTLRYNNKKDKIFGTDPVALGGQPAAIAVGNKDSSLIAVALGNQKLLLIQNGEIKSTIDLSFKPNHLNFSVDDSEIAIAGKDKVLHFFSVTGGKLSKGREYKDSDKEITEVHYRPDGSLVATIDKDKRLYFYNKDGKNLNSLGWEYHAATVTSGAWSPSGKRFATGSADESILVWSDFVKFDDNCRLHIKDAHSQGVEFLQFWDDNTLISVGSDRSIKVWDLPPLSE